MLTAGTVFHKPTGFVAKHNRVMMLICVLTYPQTTEMYLLIKRFFSICLLRASPQDLPSSSFLLLLALLLNGLVGILLAINQTTFFNAVAMSIVDVILLSGLCWLLLWARVLTLRYTQTLTALAGCSAMLALCAWPLLLWQQYGGNEAGIKLIALLMWLWFFWQIMVFSHIISQALSSPFFIGMLLTITYMFISYRVAQTLFYQESL